MMKMGRIIRQNIKHIRYTLVTVEQYLRDQIAKSRMQTPVIFWNTEPTNCDISYDPYRQTYMIHGTNMRPGICDEHSNNNNSEKNDINMDTQQENARAINSNMLRVEHNAGTNNANIPQIKHGNGASQGR